MFRQMRYGDGLVRVTARLLAGDLRCGGIAEVVAFGERAVEGL